MAGSFDPEGKMQKLREEQHSRIKSLERKAKCHPFRRPFLKGLCQECYMTRPAEDRARDAQKLKGLKALEQEVKDLERIAREANQMAKAAKEILRKRLPDYAELHWQASQNAAEKGDARPIEWALQHVKDNKETVVDPPAKAVSEGGVKVYVGLKIGGAELPAATSKSIEATVVPTDGLTD